MTARSSTRTAHLLFVFLFIVCDDGRMEETVHLLNGTLSFWMTNVDTVNSTKSHDVYMIWLSWCVLYRIIPWNLCVPEYIGRCNIHSLSLVPSLEFCSHSTFFGLPDPPQKRARCTRDAEIPTQLQSWQSCVTAEHFSPNSDWRRIYVIHACTYARQ